MPFVPCLDDMEAVLFAEFVYTQYAKAYDRRKTSCEDSSENAHIKWENEHIVKHDV